MLNSFDVSGSTTLNSTQHDMYTVSGLNCSAAPISTAREVTGSSSASNFENQATGNGNIWKSGSSNQNATPVMIAIYTSRLETSAGRNIYLLLKLIHFYVLWKYKKSKKNPIYYIIIFI